MGKLKNKDIAKALNISTAAVSMALRNKPGVSDETRKKVFAYYSNNSDIKDLPFSNIAQHKTLILNIHKTSGDIIIEKPFFSKLITSVELEARKEGYSLVVTHFESSMNLDEYVKSLNEQTPTGVLILATELTDDDLKHYQNLQMPYVLIDGYSDMYPTNAVTLDNQNAVFRAYYYAHQCGHKNIGYIKCTTPIYNFNHRFNGFLLGRSTFAADLTKPPMVFSLPGNMEQAQQAMKKKLDMLPNDFIMPTCFICDMDFIAIGAMTAFQEKGYAVPDDISIIGFDDIEYAKITTPSLTTIHLHETTLGRDAVRLLLDRIENRHSCNKNIRLSGDLVIRSSVKKII